MVIEDPDHSDFITGILIDQPRSNFDPNDFTIGMIADATKNESKEAF